MSAIFSASGNWRIERDGKLVVKEIEAEQGRFTKNLGVGTTENPQGITIYDELTGQPGCVKLVGGAVQASTGECSAPSINDQNNDEEMASSKRP